MVWTEELQKKFLLSLISIGVLCQILIAEMEEILGFELGWFRGILLSDLRKLRVDDPDGDCFFFLPVGIRDGSSQGVVSFTQHGSMLAGLSMKEDVIVCLPVPGYIAVRSDDSADGWVHVEHADIW